MSRVRLSLRFPGRAALVAAGTAAAVAIVAAAQADGHGGRPAVPAIDDVFLRTTALSSPALSSPALSSPAPSPRALTSATWCGTASTVDAKPNAVAGYPVHFIYARPSDGADRFSSFANVIQTNWETIDSWWRGQDPTRTPRADLAQFSCGLQLDLSSVQLQQSSAQIVARDTPFDQVFDSLDAQGYTSERTKYVVYYDGPVGNDNVCGIGGSVPGGFGLAVVSVRACEGVDVAQVATHELLHTLGAVPSQAPHDCAPPDDGHTCDNNRDIMYPVTDGTPLPDVLLDPGRDDYYGHSGAWLDVQDSPWLVQLDHQSPFTLAVSGTGQVESDVPGLLCTQSCTTTWNTGTQLSLTAAAGASTKFVRWGGACSGTSQCQVTVGQSGAVSALFGPFTYRLTVRVSGKGKVRGGRIACPGRCSAAVDSYTPLRLTATPTKGWKLKSWAGACRGIRPVCTLPMTGSVSARALFARKR